MKLLLVGLFTLACIHSLVANPAEKRGLSRKLKEADATIAPALDRPIRVLTANIYNYTAPYAVRMRLLRTEIEKLDPDLIAFQEAGCMPGKEHQVKQLLAGLGYHLDHECDGKEIKAVFPFGVAVASRWPIARKGLWRLSVTGTALAVEVRAPSPAGRFLFVSTVGTGRWQLDRALQREKDAVELDKFIRGNANPNAFPTVIGGDFDAVPSSASIRFLSGLQSLAGRSTHYQDAWKAAGKKGPGYTWSTENRYVRGLTEQIFHTDDHHRRIDYVFLGSPHHYRKFARIVNCRVVLAQSDGKDWPSDHYGVFAEISARPR